MIKALIFDWGGVIAPFAGGGWLGVLADMLNMTVEDLLPHWRAAGSNNLSKGIIDETEFFRLLEISLGRELPADVSRIWVDGSAFDPWPEMFDFIEQLKIDNYRVGLLSNTVKPMTVSLRQKGLYEGFNPLILSDEVGLAKPDIVIYEMILNKLQLAASECVYIDDLQNNLEPAKELGMATVLASDDPTETIAKIRQVLAIN